MEEEVQYKKSTFIRLIIISLLIVATVVLFLIVLSAFQVDHFASSDPAFGLFSKFYNIYLPLIILSSFFLSLIFMLKWKKWAYYVFQITSLIVLVFLFVFGRNEYLSIFSVLFLIIIFMLYSKQFGKKDKTIAHPDEI